MQNTSSAQVEGERRKEELHPLPTPEGCGVREQLQMIPGSITFLHAKTICWSSLCIILEEIPWREDVLGAWVCASQDLLGVQGLRDLKRLHPNALPYWLARKFRKVAEIPETVGVLVSPTIGLFRTVDVTTAVSPILFDIHPCALVHTHARTYPHTRHACTHAPAPWCAV